MRRTSDRVLCRAALGQLWLSALVAAEWRFGAFKYAPLRFSAAVEAWLAGFDVRPWPLEATHHYARMRASLVRRQARGAIDMLIVANAMAADSVIINNNAGEFHRVPSLAVAEWAL
jgi:tRNA(fMet)-specific endonuclease VapC